MKTQEYEVKALKALGDIILEQKELLVQYRQFAEKVAKTDVGGLSLEAQRQLGVHDYVETRISTHVEEADRQNKHARMATLLGGSVNPQVSSIFQRLFKP